MLLPLLPLVSLVLAPAAHALSVEASIDDGPWAPVVAVDLKQGQSLKLRVDVEGDVSWHAIVPDVSQAYKNAQMPWDPEPYKWIGFAEISYEEHELRAVRGQREVEPLSVLPQLWAAQSPRAFLAQDLGSYWLQVRVNEGREGAQRTAGVADKTRYGLSEQVLRISVRPDDSYLGWLSTYLHVPGLFGSIPRQSWNYQGVDCADVLVAAYGRWKGKRDPKDYNVAMLVTGNKHRLSMDVQAGVPDRALRWGDDVQPGDWLAVRYAGARQYQHIGALFADDGDGVLGPEDTVLHAGPQALHLSPLADGGFDGHVVVMRPQ
jgi:hypothetical protein